MSVKLISPSLKHLVTKAFFPGWHRSLALPAALAVVAACSLPNVAVDQPQPQPSPDAGPDTSVATLNDTHASAGTGSNSLSQLPAAGADGAKPAEPPMMKPKAMEMDPMDAGPMHPSSMDDAMNTTASTPEVGSVFAAWPMPDAAPGSQTTPSYGTRDNAVIDGVTHLEWQARLPQIYTGCTGTRSDADAGTVGDCCTWQEAVDYCKSYNEEVGQKGWRLPTKIELESIMDETRYSPSIDTFYFPATPNFAFWTNTLFTGVPGNAYYVGFGTGLTAYGETKFKANVRCVR